eukprot:TCALIF_08661-PA protein Name:"Protein of unknown function" AED:0.81 eAED:0.81 QI:0/0/0/0.5/0/0.5/2/0/46
MVLITRFRSRAVKEMLLLQMTSPWEPLDLMVMIVCVDDFLDTLILT